MTKHLEQVQQQSRQDAMVGVLMLDTRFPRLIGDIGNAESWPFPVCYRTVKKASAKKAIQEHPHEFLPGFIHEANALVEEGAVLITTSCGFLSVFQQELLAAIDVPVVTSALMQVPWVDSTLAGGKRCGVLTIDSNSLSAKHLAAAGAPVDTPITGMNPLGNFAATIMEDLAQFDIEACRAENIAAASQLLEQHDEVGAIVLECTNMAPYAADIQQATGVPVYSILSLVCWVYAGAAPISFTPENG